MLSELNSVTAAYQAISRVDTSAPAAPVDTTASVSAAKAAEEQSSSATSPRITVDPSAGVILQFLDSKGQIEAQSPSFAAVAYLRAGLTREGYNKAPDDAVAPAPTPITA